LAHANSIAERFSLSSKALFQTEVLRLDWSDATSRWTASTSRSDTIRARYVVSAIGLLHKLHLPAIPGIENFQGHSFHTSRWDYEYTGGDARGDPLDKLSSKRVALIGTGASAVQSLPHLTASGAQFYVFQRTPSSIDTQNNPPTDPDWAASLKPGWQEDRMLNFDIVLNGGKAEDLVNDSWTEIFRNSPIMGGDAINDPAAAAAMAQAYQMGDFRKMEQLRARIDEIVKDKKTAEALKPWYNRMCKRPCFHNEYLACYNAPNVTLVDTDGKGVDGITEKGVVANGVAYDVDCIIFATGFDFGTDYSHRANMEIRGRDMTLAEKWKDGPMTLHGMLGHGFPNFLTVSHLQSAVTPNYTHTLSERAKHVAYLVSRRFKTIEPTEEAEMEWVATIEKLAMMQGGFFRDCTPGYFSHEGALSPVAFKGAPYGLGAPAFDRLMEEWRASGKMEGVECKS
jgi:cyclohexanone monooxygenase